MMLYDDMDNAKSIARFVIVIVIFLWLLGSSCDRRPGAGENTNRQLDTMVNRLSKNDVAIESMQGDWLSQHPEKGQSFEQYKKSAKVYPGEQNGKIYLQPVGNFSPVQSRIISQTAEYLKIFFSREVVILPLIDDQKIPLVRRYAGTHEEQLKTGSMLNYLSANFPNDGLVIMAITSKDLYPGADWNFVFGQALPKARVGVSSLFRFSKSLLDSGDYRACLNHVIKTSSHEIGHTFSCLHCTHASCLMNGSNSLLEAELKPNRLCSECMKKLQWRLQFNVRKRATNLVSYFYSHKMMNDFKRAYDDLKLLQ